MSTRKWIDKKQGKTYKVVHRAHDDPLYHDEEASEHVLVEVQNPNNRKIKTKAQLEEEFKEELEDMRENEGEAALYGITYDDSKYDYMQHLKPIGKSDGVFVEKDGKVQKKKGIVFKDGFELPEDVLPSKKIVTQTYQDQQNIPDEIAGFKPDMNPALREVLEALNDEAYVEEGDDIFQDLLQGGAEEVDEEDFEDQFDEWDLDNYEDEMAQYDEKAFEKEGDEGWEADFRKYKAVSKNKKNDWDSDDEFEDEEDVVPDLPSFNANSKSKSSKGSKRKQRQKKGAMTDTSSFSMSSSANFRNEGLTLLDDRFEKVMKDFEDEFFEEEDEEEPKEFDMKNERADFEGMLDDFLDNYEIEGKRRIVKKNPELDKLKKAADSASKGKLAQRRRKENDDGADPLKGKFGNLRI